MASAAAGHSAAAVGQPVTFIGQPGFAFQPVGKVCCVQVTLWNAVVL